ncbi:hypothetical protein THIAE_02310 [Thiomicrospira aerophila AL3]|uniref:DUF4168 domain-containing protein n=1 Tax=Thiomicrospira aerophila AL3 TaxID=717772 RepID=W0DQN6_9GAMM|nr:DUF4168 domain-containing protein [Thiomicrospira aerophila]AHF00762.1 hypothetical protein THIAE_02310 [Thiomicrospira aerophila AL3]
MKLWMAALALSGGMMTTQVALAHNHTAPVSAETSAMPSDADVDLFAQSIINVENLKQKYQMDLMQMPEAEVTEQLLEEVNARFEQEAIALIEKEGMSVEKYGEMIGLLQQNPEFLAKVQQRVDALQ